MTDPFVAALARALTALAPPERLLVAVSGGADSVALLYALARSRRRHALWRLGLVVGHVDHRWRADSGLDAKLVEAHSAALGLDFALATLPRPTGHNLEERAREARYEALGRMASAHGCDAIATGHTATDQAETLLFRLARGTGARGLAAMAPERALGDARLLRPLLHALREETRAFCEREGLLFRDDPTNAGDRVRARLRREVLPALERIVPGATRHLSQAAARLKEDDTALEKLLAARSLQDERRSLADLPPALRRRALAAWVERATGSRRRLAATHLAALEKLVVDGRGEVELPSDSRRRRVATLRGGRLMLEERPHERAVTAPR